MERQPPWNQRCPKPLELTTKELISYLKQAPNLVKPLTDWELSFCASVLRHLESNMSNLTEAQYTKLSGKIMRRLWDEDPRLWED